MYTTSVNLLAQLRKPNSGEAWDRFVKLYTPFLIRVLIKHFKVPMQDVPDLVQDIFVGLVRTLPNFEYDSQHKRFRGYLHQVCHNKVINFRRKLSGHADEDADLSSLEDARRRRNSKRCGNRITTNSWHGWLSNSCRRSSSRPPGRRAGSLSSKTARRRR